MKNEYIVRKFGNGIHYIVPDQKIVEKFVQERKKRLICRLNDLVEFHCAVLSKNETGYFVYVGNSICKKMKISEGSKVYATFEADHTEYQFEMPEELEEVLLQDQEANTVFQSLTGGNQRGLMYLVSQVKSSEKKIERALKIADKLKTGITSPKTILN